MSKVKKMIRAGLCFVVAIYTLSVDAGQVTAKQTKKSIDVNPDNTPEYFENVSIYAGATRIPVVAKQALLIDFFTGQVLLEKNADQQMAPSSMTKMMTTYLVEEKILTGQISNETEFAVSEKAWRTQGSKMFVGMGTKVKVADLHRGIAIQSGNDASIVAAEGLNGSEEAFAAEMNLMATKLGMSNTQFKNASGLHEDGHFSTARDLSKLAIATIKDHSKFYGINQEKEFTYNGIKQGNRNPLLYDDIGCDGIKTGHTDAGGYGVTASCVDGIQRFVLVINGLSSIKARAEEAQKLIRWAKANFMAKYLVRKGDVVDKAAKIELGVKETVPLIAADDLYMMMLRSEQDKIQLNPILDTTLNAPVPLGARGGKLVASLGQFMTEVDLVTAESVDKLGWFKRFLKLVRIM